MVIVGIPMQIKSDNALAYVSTKMKQFYCMLHIKHIIWILHNPTGQAIVEIPNHTLKEMHFKQKGDIRDHSRDRLHNALLTLKIFKC